MFYLGLLHNQESGVSPRQKRALALFVLRSMAGAASAMRGTEQASGTDQPAVGGP